MMLKQKFETKPFEPVVTVKNTSFNAALCSVQWKVLETEIPCIRTGHAMSVSETKFDQRSFVQQMLQGSYFALA